MSQEKVYYQDSNVTITNARAILSGKTYAMANITSVSATVRPPNRLWAIVFAGSGLCCIMAGLATSLFEVYAVGLESAGVGGGVVGLVLGGIGVAIGVLMWIATKAFYRVTVGSASGEVHALESHDKEYVQKLVAAMNQAIIERG